MNKKYPFQEGDDYWTLKESTSSGVYEAIIIWGCWDDVSEELHDKNPDTEYYTNDEVLDIARVNGINVSH